MPTMIAFLVVSTCFIVAILTLTMKLDEVDKRVKKLEARNAALLQEFLRGGR